jgi:hypothetical protein
MGTSRIPEDVHAAIKQCWPDGVVHELATDESYFHEIHPRLERDLRKIRGASLRWQSEDEEGGGAGWDEDENDELPPIDAWQSYYVFFLAPHGKEFHFACETTSVDEGDAEEETSTETTYPGEGWIGCAAGVCLAAPYAVINACSYSRYEDGTTSTPDVESFIYSDDPRANRYRPVSSGAPKPGSLSEAGRATTRACLDPGEAWHSSLGQGCPESAGNRTQGQRGSLPRRTAASARCLFLSRRAMIAQAVAVSAPG